MNGTILITDSLFIFDEHVKQLEAAGYGVVRLDEPKATEEELVEAVKGKIGYILGGVETVTNKVIDAADKLKVIMVTGTGYDSFIPDYKYAQEKGIKIGAASHLNAYAVAEFGFTMTLAMVRELFNMSRGYGVTFKTTKSMVDMTVGVVGLGHIGTHYARMCRDMGVKNIMYSSRSRKNDIEAELGAEKADLEQVFMSADIIFVALPFSAGEKYISANLIDSMKPGAILVSIADEALFDLDALYSALKASRITAAFDENIKQERFQDLPLGTWYTPNESTAFNTEPAIRDVNNCSVKTILEILETGEADYRVL